MHIELYPDLNVYGPQRKASMFIGHEERSQWWWLLISQPHVTPFHDFLHVTFYSVNNPACDICMICHICDKCSMWQCDIIGCPQLQTMWPDGQIVSWPVVYHMQHVTCDMSHGDPVSATLWLGQWPQLQIMWPDDQIVSWPVAYEMQHFTCHMSYATCDRSCHWQRDIVTWSVATIADNVTWWPVDRLMATWPGLWRRSGIVSSSLCSPWHVLTETRTTETGGPENGFC